MTGGKAEGRAKPKESAWAEVRDRRRRSRPPFAAGLCAGGRGLANHSTREADALLTWYRTAGAWNGREVRLYLARRAIAATWICTTQQAAAIIESAMAHVLVPTRRPGGIRPELPPNAGMRKGLFLDLRGQAV